MAKHSGSLADRVDIAPDLPARLQAASTLYDIDEAGSFLQLCSQLFAGGMVFDLGERRGAYQEYRGPHKPFRIAAQKRLMRPKGMPRG